MEDIITGDEVYSKIETLKKIKEDNWVTYCIDEKNGEKWIDEYPHGEYHGGSAPQLRKINEIPDESKENE